MDQATSKTDQNIHKSNNICFTIITTNINKSRVFSPSYQNKQYKYFSLELK